ncbi:MAG: hypothetical protein WC637_02860 [Victivallales bacterium]|jgi:hypothetical protein
MKRVLVVMCAVGLLVLAAMAEESASPSSAKTRVGVYDSRAIAVAFINSQVYKDTDGKKLNEMIAEHDKAKAEGNKKRVDELEAWGKEQQTLLHKQGFSTAPVDGILIHIKDQMPEIAKTAGVVAIVSKWDKETLAKYKSAELVDVTMALVNAFHPTERQLKAAIEIQKHDPLPLEQIDKGHGHK